MTYLSGPQWRTLPVKPEPAPRQNWNSHKNPRMKARLGRYNAFKDVIRDVYKVQIPENVHRVELLFLIPMPKSWPKWRKAACDDQQHRQKPDGDNLEKAFIDAACSGLPQGDAYIPSVLWEKRWTSGEGEIRYRCLTATDIAELGLS